VIPVGIYSLLLKELPAFLVKLNKKIISSQKKEGQIQKKPPCPMAKNMHKDKD
jgi:hypothetical protein